MKQFELWPDLSIKAAWSSPNPNSNPSLNPSPNPNLKSLSKAFGLAAAAVARPLRLGLPLSPMFVSSKKVPGDVGRSFFSIPGSKGGQAATGAEAVLNSSQVAD